MPDYDIKKVKRLLKLNNDVIDLRPIIFYMLKHQGSTYKEIGEVFGISKQRAQQIVKAVEDKL